jgi:hypothetical protein
MIGYTTLQSVSENTAKQMQQLSFTLWYEQHQRKLCQVVSQKKNRFL